MRAFPVLLWIGGFGCTPEADKGSPGESVHDGDTDDPADSAEDSDTADTSEGAPEEEGRAKLQGFVRTLDGDPIGGARITAGAVETTSDALGFYTLYDLPPGEVLVSVEAEGFGVTAVARTTRARRWAYAGLSLAPRERLSGGLSDGETWETDSGVRVTLPAEGLLDAMGLPFTGVPQLAVTLLSGAGALSAAPGEGMADRDGQVALLNLAGAVEIVATDELGSPLQLAAPATISLPLWDGEGSVDPEALALFGFDGATGRWQETGGGSPSEGRFEAEIDAFGWWAASTWQGGDQCVTGALVGADGPLDAALIQVSLLGLRLGAFPTGSDGRFLIALPAGQRASLSLAYGAEAWEGESIDLPSEAVAAEERPGGCVDLGEITAEDADLDDDGAVGPAWGGPDCEDGDPEVRPDAADPPYSGADEDCGGEDDYDWDQDGYVADAHLGLPTAYAPGTGGLPGGDCLDEDPWTHPGRADTCDGHDDDCSGDESNAVDAEIWYEDGDGDGFGADGSARAACDTPDGSWILVGGDCDDGEPTAWPGADEVCGDLVDYDCDGIVRDDDADGDGALACADCDDGEPAAWPGAEEICDGIDNDCDGEADVGASDAKRAYADGDSDGFVDRSILNISCAVPEGYLEDTGALQDDCDDADASVYPGAAEICGDGVIQDCDADRAVTMDTCGWDGDRTASESDAELLGVAASDYAGSGLASAGDVNGDGSADLLIGAPYEDTAASAAGAAYLVLGPVSGSRSLSTADARLLGTSASVRAGTTVAGALDTDGDGYDDVLVSAPYEDTTTSDAGVIFLTLGPLSGDMSLSAANASFQGEYIRGYLDGMTSASDVNDDGYDDLLIGAGGSGASGASQSGCVHLFLGPMSGTLSLSASDASVQGTTSGDRAGDGLATGDINGDGEADLVIGAPYRDTGGSGSGVVYVALGPVSGTLGLRDAEARLIGEDSNDYAGGSVAATGDVNDDGYGDFAVGARGDDDAASNAGAVYLVHGPVSSRSELASAEVKLLGEVSGDAAGTELVRAGDVDGDGLMDLLVGASENDSAGTSSGAAYVVLSPLSGTSSLGDAPARILGTVTFDTVGLTLSSAGDMDMDGRADLLVYAVHPTATLARAGAAHLFLSPGW